MPGIWILTVRCPDVIRAWVNKECLARACSVLRGEGFEVYRSWYYTNAKVGYSSHRGTEPLSFYLEYLCASTFL